MGTVCRDEGLDGKVEAMRTFLGKGGKSTPLTVKLDDPAGKTWLRYLNYAVFR